MELARNLNIASKVIFVVLVFHYLLNSDLPQYQNKGMHFRLVVYSLIIASVFITVSLIRIFSKRKFSYPHTADALITLAFVGDWAGNTFNLFDTITWWDDLMHFVLWALWVMAAGIILRIYSNLARWTVAGLIVGFGAVTSIIWELAEYSTFVRTNSNELLAAYRDTMGDELLSLSGSVLAALLLVLVFWRLKSFKNR